MDRERCRRDFWFWLQSYGWLYNPKANISAHYVVPFQPWPRQVEPGEASAAGGAVDGVVGGAFAFGGWAVRAEAFGSGCYSAEVIFLSSYMLPRTCTVFGCSGPSTFSRMARARSNSGSASSKRLWSR